MNVSPIAAIAWSVVMAGLLGATLIDFRTRIIPNGYVLLIAGAAAALRFAIAGPAAWTSVVVALTVFLVLIVLSNLALFGGGDAKLIAAVTLLAAPDRLAVLILCVVLAGGLVSCCYLLARAMLTASAMRQLVANPIAAPRTLGRRHLLHAEAVKILAGEPMPYALAVLGGVIIYSIIEVTRCVSATSCLS